MKNKFLEQKVSVLFTENSIPTKVHANMDLRSAENLEKIADEFAIGFAEWCDNKGYTQVGNNFWKSLNDEYGKTSKELLEIYKKTL